MDSHCQRPTDLKFPPRNKYSTNQIVIKNSDLLTPNIIEMLDNWFAALEAADKSKHTSNQVILNSDSCGLNNHHHQQQPINSSTKQQQVASRVTDTVHNSNKRKSGEMKDNVKLIVSTTKRRPCEKQRIHLEFKKIPRIHTVHK